MLYHVLLSPLANVSCAMSSTVIVTDISRSEISFGIVFGAAAAVSLLVCRVKCRREVFARNETMCEASAK